PEGTRSPTGEMTDFKASLGYLALTNRVGVLPLYLRGTYDALPKGSMLPRDRRIAALIGPFITYDELRARTESLPRSEAYRVASGLVEQAVKCLRDGKRWLPESAAPAPASAREQPKAAGEAKRKRLKRP